MFLTSVDTATVVVAVLITTTILSLAACCAGANSIVAETVNQRDY